MRSADPKSISYERLEPTVRTGDVFLFHGESSVSKGVEKATRSRFSHAAMVIRPHLSRRPMLWQTGPKFLVKDQLTLSNHGGAQLGDLHDVLIFMGQPRFGDTPYCRKLNIKRTPEFEKMAMLIVSDIDGRKFPKMTQMARQYAAGTKMRSESDRTLFCAELVAETFMRLGVLFLHPPPNAYSPKHFSEQYHSLPLRHGAWFEPERKVLLPTK